MKESYRPIYNRKSDRNQDVNTPGYYFRKYELINHICFRK